MEAIKPLIVLGLLGTILYGAYSVVQKGPSSQQPDWQTPAATQAMAEGGLGDAPPFAAGPAGPATVAPPSVEISPAPAAAPMASAPPPFAGHSPSLTPAPTVPESEGMAGVAARSSLRRF